MECAKGLHHTIIIYFMVAGHMKFGLVGSSGLLKRTFWKAEANSLADIE